MWNHFADLNAIPAHLKKGTVVLQSHLDMVHQKNLDTNFDFDKRELICLLMAIG